MSQDFLFYLLLLGLIILLCIAIIYYYQLAKNYKNQSLKAINDLKAYQKEEDEIFAEIQIGKWEWDIIKNTITWDHKTHNIFGFQQRKFRGGFEDFIKLVHAEDRHLVQNQITKCIDEKKKYLDFMIRIIRNDGSIKYITTKAEFTYDDQMIPVRLHGICWDITPIKRSEKMISAFEAITKILSEHISLQEALKKLIDTLNYYLGFDVLTFWQKDPISGKMRCLEVHSAPSVYIHEFKRATMKLYPSKLSMPEIILTTLRPVWIKDVTKDSSFNRIKEATNDRIVGGVAFPLFENEYINSIVELYLCNQEFNPNEEGIFNLISAIGIELGQFIKRQESEKLIHYYYLMLKYSNEAIYIVDKNFCISSWNEACEKVFQWTKEEILGQPVNVLYPVEKTKEFTELINQLQKGIPIEHHETERVRKDGHRLNLFVTIYPILDENRHIQSFFTINHNVTVEKELLENLRLADARFHDFVETTQDWVWEMDEHNKFSYSNLAVKKILGYSPSEIIGKNFLFFFSDEERKNEEQDLEHYISRKKGWTHRVIRVQNKYGSICILESNAEVRLDHSGNFIGFRGVNRDITERINIENSKNEFISMVSHELRTPLTSIHGAIGLLLKMNSKNEKEKELLQLAFRNSERLNAIINDILDIQKLQLGKLEFNIRPINIADVIRESIASSKNSAHAANVTIIEEGILTDVKVMADYSRIVQVMMNLISNAIKFSRQHGKIYISMEESPFDVRVSIKDEGIGMPEEFLPHIFKKFFQADRSDARLIAGTGLGLNICKTIIEKCNGKIGFTTKQNVGTTFYFDLPKEV